MDYGKFEPKIHDFGDNYHKSDEELYLPSFNEVRQLKRIYRNYNEYLDALEIIKKYIKELAKRYGDDFLWYYDLGDIKEFIPTIPSWKKTEENVVFSKLGVRLSNQAKDTEFDYKLSDDIDESIKNSSAFHGQGFEIVPCKLAYVPGNVEIENKKVYEDESDDAETVSKELEILRLFQDQQGKIDKTSDTSIKNIKKEEKKRLKVLAKMRAGKSFYDRIEEYEDEYNGISKPEEESSLMFYKGISVSRDDLYRTKILESLVKAGLVVKKSANKEISNKELRKMIKKERKEFMKEYSDNDVFDNVTEKTYKEYEDEDFRCWEQEMSALKYMEQLEMQWRSGE